MANRGNTPTYARRWFAVQERLSKQRDWKEWVGMVRSDQRASDLMCVLEDALYALVTYGMNRDPKAQRLIEEMIGSVIFLYGMGYERAHTETALEGLYQTEGE